MDYRREKVTEDRYFFTGNLGDRSVNTLLHHMDTRFLHQPKLQ